MLIGCEIKDDFIIGHNKNSNTHKRLMQSSGGSDPEILNREKVGGAGDWPKVGSLQRFQIKFIKSVTFFCALRGWPPWILLCIQINFHFCFTHHTYFFT